MYPNAVAKVAVGNISSQCLFKKAGFKTKYYLLEYEKDNT